MPDVKTRKRLLYLVTEDWYFVSHRLDLARAARDAGWDVHVATRVVKHGREIQDEGFHVHPIELSRSSRNIFREANLVLRIARLYRTVRPDVVHHVALKPVLYGTVASWPRRRVLVINAFAGMGTAFSGSRSVQASTRRVLTAALRRLLKQRQVIVVQNLDDMRLLLAMIPHGSRRLVHIPGSGIDTERFVERGDPGNQIPVTTFVGRMLWDKGLGELVAAAHLLRDRGVPVCVRLVGEPDPENPNSIDPDVLEDWSRKGLVQWFGPMKDIPAVWATSDIAVLPSYREGLPRSLLEAASSGRPLIAFDVPGCRDLVRNGSNGILVPFGDVTALAEAIEFLVRNPATRHKMGAQARRDVTGHFSNTQVIGQFLDLYEEHDFATEL